MIDVRHLAVRGSGVAAVASCVLKVDGATALLDAVSSDPTQRGRGHGDALVSEALSLAAAAGCDLVVLGTAADSWPRHWYARRGFTDVTTSWMARLG